MKDLIEKYFNGETTLEEEARLRAYFSGDKVEESLQQYQSLFRFFEAEKGQQVSDDFDQTLLCRLEEGGGKVVLMQTWRRNLLRMAAVGAVLLIAFFFLEKPFVHPNVQAGIDWSKYEIKDEKLAYEETVKALKLVSAKLKKGSRKASREVEKVEKVSKYFN
jgi:hypothetical protein